jgi:hypothetical protein
MNKIKHLSIVDGAFPPRRPHPPPAAAAAADGRDTGRPKARNNGAPRVAAVTA